MSRIRQGRVPDIIRTELGIEAYEFFDDWFRETFGPDIGQRGKLDRNNVVNVENLQTGESTANKVLRTVGNDNVAFDISPGLDAEYLTLSPNADLINERVVVGGTNITITDGTSNATFAVSPQGTGSLLDSDTVDGREATGFVWSLAKSGEAALTQDVTLSQGANVTLTQAGNNIEIASSGSGGGGAPTDAQYLVLATDATLTNERVFTPGTSLSVTDNGAGLGYDVDTIQSIRVTDSPAFAGLTLSGFGAGVVQSNALGVLSSSTLSHTSLGDIGSNSHASIDSHIADGSIHFTQGSIDHTLITNIGTNTHAQIDTHIADGTIHFTVGSIDHTLISNIGTNTHAQIDTHIADSTIHFTVGSIDHTLISNIGTNTHAQIDAHIADSTIHFTVGSIDHTLITNIGTNTHAQIDSHIADGTIHFAVGSIDHTAIQNIGTNTHAQIDTHIADATIHFTEASIDHTAITNIGTNNHAAIDSHIADATIHFTEASIDHTAITNIGTNNHAAIDSHIADGTIHFTVASINHGSIAGLTNDDHTQYHTDARALTWLGGRSTSDLPEGSNLYYTDARSRAAVSAAGDLSYVAATGVFSVTTYKSTDFDADFGAKTTDNLTEGTTNLYYTDARSRAAVSAAGDLSYVPATGVFSVTTYKSADFDSDFGSKTTDNLTEGSTNLYYASSLFDTDFGNKDTDDLSEGTTNLYYTDERAQDGVAGILTDTASVSWTYDDAANTIEAEVLPAGVDHGGLDGLADDDHTQYLLIAGTRAMTGSLTMGTTGGLDVDFYGADDGTVNFTYNGGIEWNTRRTGLTGIARTYWSNGGAFNVFPSLIEECNSRRTDHTALSVFSYNVTSFDGTNGQQRWLVEHNRAATRSTILGITAQKETKGFPVTFNGAHSNITGTTEVSWGHNNNSGPIVMPVRIMLMKVSVCLNAALGAGDTGSFDIEYSTDNKATWTTLGTFTASTGKFKETFDFGTSLAGLALNADADFSLRTNNNASFSKTSADPSFVVYGFTNANI